jgi:hypothetical protein
MPYEGEVPLESILTDFVPSADDATSVEIAVEKLNPIPSPS